MVGLPMEENETHGSSTISRNRDYDNNWYFSGYNWLDQLILCVLLLNVCTI